MNLGDGDDYEAHCVNCGAGYWLEVGFSLGTCSHCGKSQTETDDECAAREAGSARAQHEWNSGETLRKNLIGELESMEFWLDMGAVPCAAADDMRAHIDRFKDYVRRSRIPLIDPSASSTHRRRR